MPREDLIRPFRICFLFSYATLAQKEQIAVLCGPCWSFGSVTKSVSLNICEEEKFRYIWTEGKGSHDNLYEITQVKGQVYSSSLTDNLYSGDWGRRIALSFRTQWVPRWPGLACAVCPKNKQKWWRVHRREVKMSDCSPAASRKGPCPCHCRCRSPGLCL